MTLTDPQLEALAVLRHGPALRTKGRTGIRLVNRQAMLALVRRELARSTGDGSGRIAITDEGCRAHEAAMR